MSFKLKIDNLKISVKMVFVIYRQKLAYGINYVQRGIKMGKIIQAREEDRGMKGVTTSVLFVISLITGFIGVPIGAILSAVMQTILEDSSAPVMYGFFLGPVMIGMLTGFFYMKKIWK